MKKQQQALEITTFKLAGYKPAAFMAANADIDEWLKQQPGFRWRYISVANDGCITDVLLWDSVAQGTDAMHRIISETSNSMVHQMINHNTVDWKCLPVAHSV